MQSDTKLYLWRVINLGKLESAMLRMTAPGIDDSTLRAVRKPVEGGSKTYCLDGKRMWAWRQETIGCLSKPCCTATGQGYPGKTCQHDLEIFEWFTLSIALLSLSENHARSYALQAFLVKDLNREFLIETKKCTPIGKTPVKSGFARSRSPRVTEERYSNRQGDCYI